jgi:hypothetical protein
MSDVFESASSSTSGWKGFKPRAYCLDWGKVWNLSLTNVENSKATSIGEVISAFRDEHRKVHGIPDVGNLKNFKSRSVRIISLSGDTMQVQGPLMHLFLLTMYFWCHRQGNPDLDIRWYYLDSAVMDGDIKGYGFFLVTQSRISEVVSVFDFKESGFEPSLFQPEYTTPPFDWIDEEEWSIATDTFWYRKFYGDTEIGQTMILRSEKPTVFNSEAIKRAYSV